MAKPGDLTSRSGAGAPSNTPRKPAAPGLAGLSGLSGPNKSAAKPAAAKPARGQQQPGGGKAPVARRPKV